MNGYSLRIRGSLVCAPRNGRDPILIGAGKVDSSFGLISLIVPFVNPFLYGAT